MQNDLSAVLCDGKVPALTSQKKEQSFGRLVPLNDYRGPRKMPWVAADKDRTKFGRRQSGKTARPEPVGEANNTRAS